MSATATSPYDPREAMRNGQTTEDRLAWLALDDEESRPYRGERLAFLLELHGPESHFLLPGGLLSFRAYEEARLAYLHGLYVATITLTQVCIEKALVGMGRIAGDDVEKLGLNQLLRHCIDRGLLTPDESARLHELRRLRNPYVHGRSPTDLDTVERRAVALDTNPEDLIAEDAQAALRILYAFLDRARF